MLATALTLLVLRPALERGGVAELLMIVAFFGAVLLLERWLRSR